MTHKNLQSSVFQVYSISKSQLSNFTVAVECCLLYSEQSIYFYFYFLLVATFSEELYLTKWAAFIDILIPSYWRGSVTLQNVILYRCCKICPEFFILCQGKAFSLETYSDSLFLPCFYSGPCWNLLKCYFFHLSWIFKGIISLIFFIILKEGCL